MATAGTQTGRPVRARRCVSSKRELFPALQKSPPPLQPSVETWTEEENKALVEFVLFYGDQTVWPSHSKKSRFWVDAANYVQCRSRATNRRTGK